MEVQSSDGIGTNATKFAVRTPAQLKSRTKELGQQENLVDGLIPQQAIVLLVGDSGLGKSPLLYQLSVAIATGQLFLGKKVRRGSVLYMDCENGLVGVDETIDRVSTHLGVHPPDNLWLWNLNDCADEFDSDGHRLEDIIAQYKPSLVIIDPLSAIYSGIERDNPTASKAYKELRTIMKKHSCSVIGVHHTRKTDTQNGTRALDQSGAHEWLQEARGPRVIINGSDVRLALDQASGYPAGEVVVIQGFERLHGEIAPLLLGKDRDAEGKAVGYSILSGAKLLAGEDDQAAYEKLGDEFSTKEAMVAYGKKDEATQGFLRRCEKAGILRKRDRGSWQKMNSPEPSEAATALVNHAEDDQLTIRRSIAVGRPKRGEGGE